MSVYKAGAAEFFVERAERLKIPAGVTFQITDRCNYRCAHCYETHRDEDELSTAEIERILAEIAEAGVLFLTFTGGEVYMRRDIDQILATSRRLRFAVRLFTTGHHIDDARADRLKELAIQEVHLSLYGPDAESHEAVTLMPGSFERTVAAAKRLRARDIYVVLKTPIMTVNVRRHQELIALTQELGCKYAFDAKLTSREDGDRSPLHLRPSDDDVSHFYATYDLNEIMQGARDPLTFDLAKSNATTPCRIGQTACSINPQGLVFGCVALPIAVGDLRKERFLDVWRGSNELAYLRNINWADIPICNTCTLRPWCSRCHAMALLEDGKILGPSTESCRQAVAKREVMRSRGMIPADTPQDLPAPLLEKAAPPRTVNEKLVYGFRPAALRILQ